MQGNLDTVDWRYIYAIVVQAAQQQDNEEDAKSIFAALSEFGRTGDIHQLRQELLRCHCHGTCAATYSYEEVYGDE